MISIFLIVVNNNKMVGEAEKDYIIMKAIVFPQINLLWLGTVITIGGFLISLVRIWQKRRNKKQSVTTL